MADEKHIRPERVAAAIRALADWRLSAKSMPAMHLWPLIAIVRGGANTSARKKGYSETSVGNR